MTQDAGAELLTQLRDIHTAPEAPFWPPAPGWWLLAVLVLIGLGLLARVLARRLRERRRRQALLDRLAALRHAHDPQDRPQAWLADVNRLLKVTALRRFPAAGPLQGEAWARFLGGEEGAGAYTALADGPWRRNPEYDPDDVEAAARDWIRRHG